MASTDIVRRAAWTINRLRSMSAAEVATRTRRAAAQRLEQARVRRGWSPGADVPLLGTRPLFAALERDLIVADWQEMFQIDRDAADRLIGGQVTLFSKAYDIGPSPDWSRDPETGRVAPYHYGMAINYRDTRVVGNIKVLWELGRQQYLVPLAVRYAVTGDTRFRDAVVSHIDSWVSANPFAMGIHWCSAMEVALRAISWTLVHSLIALRDGEAGLPGASRDREALAEALYNHGHFVRHHLSRHSSANNHLMGELVGLWCLARVFDFGAASRHWADQAKHEIEREARLQVHPDGVAREQAVHYQVELLEYLLLARCVGQATGAPMPGAVPQSIAGMHRFLCALRPAGGSFPRIGDSDEGLVLRFDLGRTENPAADVVEAVDRVFRAPAGPPRSEKAFWYGCLAAGAAGSELDASVDGASAAPGPLRVFQDGGYVILADAGLHLVFDAGPLGYLSIAAHGHADALSICAAWNGRWWLVDPGTFAYQENPRYRSYFRGTSAHNTATVNGQDQSQQTGPFMWTRHARARLEEAGRAGDGIRIQGSHDGYRRLGLEHRRRIEYREGTAAFRVIDEIAMRGEAQSAEVALNFHFHPEVALELARTECLARWPGTEQTLHVALDPQCEWRMTRGAEDPILGWYSPSFGEKTPCWTLTGSLSVTGHRRTAVAFSPAQPAPEQR